MGWKNDTPCAVFHVYCVVLLKESNHSQKCVFPFRTYICCLFVTCPCSLTRPVTNCNPDPDPDPSERNSLSVRVGSRPCCGCCCWCCQRSHEMNVHCSSSVAMFAPLRIEKKGSVAAAAAAFVFVFVFVVLIVQCSRQTMMVGGMMSEIP